MLKKRAAAAARTEYPADCPRCVVAHNVDLPRNRIDELMRPFRLHGYEVKGDCIWSYHKNAASAADFVEAFGKGFAGVPGTWITEESSHDVAQREIPDTRLLNFYVSTGSIHWTLTKRRLTAVKRAPVRKKKEPVRNEPYERSVMRCIEEGSRSFEDIKQPKIKRESSRLTPVHKIKEWHKREYLRPYAQARREQYVVGRASGSPMFQSQFIDAQQLPQRRRGAQSTSVGRGVAGKRVYFEKSPIQGYGLFALEPIDAGEFICEYYGQMIRMQVADKRERQFDKQGFQHTYMFRLGDDVIDATNHGSNARFLNCSCKPNCRAEEIKIQNANTVSFFAIRRIKAHDEIVFDFKLELADCMENLERCYCGAKRCNGFLNYSIYENVLKERLQRALC